MLVTGFPERYRSYLYWQQKVSLTNHENPLRRPCWNPAVLSSSPLPQLTPVQCPSDPNVLFEGKTCMCSLLAFQRAIDRAYIGNRNGVSQATKINYDGPAEIPLWRHSPPSCVPQTQMLVFWGQNLNVLVTGFLTRYRSCLYWQQKQNFKNHDNKLRRPCWDPAMTSPPPLLRVRRTQIFFFMAKMECTRH